MIMACIRETRIILIEKTLLIILPPLIGFEKILLWAYSYFSSVFVSKGALVPTKRISAL